MPNTNSVVSMMLAQSDGGGTPYLDVSQNMGRIVAICAVLIVIVFVAQKLMKKKSK